MAFLINNNQVISNSSGLTNIGSTDAATTTSIFNGIINNSTITAGNTIRAARNGETTHLVNNTAYYDYHRWDMLQRGNITFTWQSRADTASSNAGVQLVRYRNGAASTVYTNAVNNTTYATVSTTQAIITGDVFIIQFRSGFVTSGKSSSYVRVRIRSNRLLTSTTTIWMPAGSNLWYHSYT